jgi:hypothetical protein
MRRVMLQGYRLTGPRCCEVHPIKWVDSDSTQARNPKLGGPNDGATEWETSMSVAQGRDEKLVVVEGRLRSTGAFG